MNCHTPGRSYSLYVTWTLTLQMMISNLLLSILFDASLHCCKGKHCIVDALNWLYFGSIHYVAWTVTRTCIVFIQWGWHCCLVFYQYSNLCMYNKIQFPTYNLIQRCFRIAQIQITCKEVGSISIVAELNEVEANGGSRPRQTFLVRSFRQRCQTLQLRPSAPPRSTPAGLGWPSGPQSSR